MPVPNRAVAWDLGVKDEYSGRPYLDETEFEKRGYYVAYIRARIRTRQRLRAINEGFQIFLRDFYFRRLFRSQN